VMEAIKEGNAAAAKTALKNAVKTIDKAASKGVYHKNNASRKKSTLTKLVNQLSA
jgi:small subunit ribosomal protein S20